MFNLILWALAFVLHLAHIWPPLSCSESSGARVARFILATALGSCIGMGLGHALAVIL